MGAVAAERYRVCRVRFNDVKNGLFLVQHAHSSSALQPGRRRSEKLSDGVASAQGAGTHQTDSSLSQD